VLRGIDRIAQAANRNEIPVSVCGEMGHEKDWIPFLIGIGIKTLSVDPQFFSMVQQTIATFTIEQAQTYAQDLLKETSIYGIEKQVDNWRRQF
jgi:phosphotransferase system enzyme I (PtsP)